MISTKTNRSVGREPSRLCIVPILIIACFMMGACGQKQAGNSPSEPPRESIPPAATQASPSDGVRRVTIPELREALAKGEALVIDVRSEVDFKLGHITGARSIPLGLLAGRAKELPRDKLIVTYCA
jgi:hypothetical protein